MKILKEINNLINSLEAKLKEYRANILKITNEINKLKEELKSRADGQFELHKNKAINDFQIKLKGNIVKSFKTNLNGESSLTIKKGEYFLFGITHVGQNNIIWNLPVNIEEKEHYIEISNDNAFAIDEGYLENNPVKKIKFYPENPARERVLTEKEERRLMQASSEHLKSVLIVALNSGMRASEILSLQCNQVDFGAKKIRVEKTKSGKIRFININTPLLEELLKLRERNGQSPFVFPNSETGRPLNSVKKAFKGACRRAGIKGLRLHDLRHTFASRLIAHGVDIETLRSLLGHYSILITQRYMHSNDERKQKAVELLSKKPKEKAKNRDNLLHIRYMEKEKSKVKSLEKPITPFYSVN